MPNLLITLKFDGSAYHGFQVQKNAITICEQFQNAVEKILGMRYNVKGCSRTDSGVHAEMFCLSVKTDSQIPEANLLRALNTALPHDIAVTDVRRVPDEFHARYSCVSKTYRYIIYNAPHKDPFRPTRVLHYPLTLDADMLDKQARNFIGEHDFSAFCAAGSSVTDNVRSVKDAKVFRCGDDVIFEVSANGFLYNMVRIMAGTLLDIAAGRIPPGEIPAIIESRDRKNAGKTAPARGLYLYFVEY